MGTSSPEHAGATTDQGSLLGEGICFPDPSIHRFSLETLSPSKEAPPSPRLKTSELSLTHSTVPSVLSRFCPRPLCPVILLACHCPEREALMLSSNPACTRGEALGQLLSPTPTVHGDSVHRVCWVRSACCTAPAGRLRAPTQERIHLFSPTLCLYKHDAFGQAHYSTGCQLPGTPLPTPRAPGWL